MPSCGDGDSSIPVVEMFADVREVFKDDNRRGELLDVLNDFSGGLLHDVRERILIVVEAVVCAPLFGIALVQTLQHDAGDTLARYVLPSSRNLLSVRGVISYQIVGVIY